MKKRLAIIILFLIFLFGCKKSSYNELIIENNKASDKKIMIYTALDDEETKLYFSKFTELTGIATDSIRKSSNEIRTLLEAEKNNPIASVIYGGTTDLYIAAKDDGLLEKYVSENGAIIDPKYKDKEGYWTGIYTGAIGFATNLEKNVSKLPESWYDLLNPEYKGEISIANPASSGTAYTVLATLIQIIGEDKTFEYMEKLHGNIVEYTSSGSKPAKMASDGLITIGVSFAHDAIKEKLKNKKPVAITFPKEGTGYEIGAVALVKNAPNIEMAKKFVDFSLSKKCQDLYKEVCYRIPTNPDAEILEGAVPLSEISTIDYDFETYGRSEERDRLTKKWNDKFAK